MATLGKSKTNANPKQKSKPRPPKPARISVQSFPLLKDIKAASPDGYELDPYSQYLEADARQKNDFWKAKIDKSQLSTASNLDERKAATNTVKSYLWKPPIYSKAGTANPTTDSRGIVLGIQGFDMVIRNLSKGPLQILSTCPNSTNFNPGKVAVRTYLVDRTIEQAGSKVIRGGNSYPTDEMKLSVRYSAKVLPLVQQIVDTTTTEGDFNVVLAQMAIVRPDPDIADTPISLASESVEISFNVLYTVVDSVKPGTVVEVDPFGVASSSDFDDIIALDPVPRTGPAVTGYQRSLGVPYLALKQFLKQARTTALAPDFVGTGAVGNVGLLQENLQLRLVEAAGNGTYKDIRLGATYEAGNYFIILPGSGGLNTLDFCGCVYGALEFDRTTLSWKVWDYNTNSPYLMQDKRNGEFSSVCFFSVPVMAFNKFAGRTTGKTAILNGKVYPVADVKAFGLIKWMKVVSKALGIIKSALDAYLG